MLMIVRGRNLSQPVATTSYVQAAYSRPSTVPNPWKLAFATELEATCNYMLDSNSFSAEIVLVDHAYRRCAGESDERGYLMLLMPLIWRGRSCEDLQAVVRVICPPEMNSAFRRLTGACTAKVSTV